MQNFSRCEERLNNRTLIENIFDIMRIILVIHRTCAVKEHVNFIQTD